MNLLSVENLSIEYRSRRGTVRAVRNISVELEAGKTLGVVGESGCGKSTLAMGVLGLLPPTAAVADGAVRLRGRDLVRLDAEKLRALRWRHMAYVPQSAMNSLNPVARLRDQFHEIWQAHGGTRHGVREKAEALFVRVGLDPRRLDSYPHELSGGMRKRTALAQVLALDPDIILMDEPFSALDVQTRQLMENEVLALWAAKKKAVLFITHDLDEAIAMSDRVVVFSAGPASRPIGEFEIDLPRPRDVAEVRTQPRFVELHRQIWAVLRDEVLKGYAQQLKKAA